MLLRSYDALLQRPDYDSGGQETVFVWREGEALHRCTLEGPLLVLSKACCSPVATLFSWYLAEALKLGCVMCRGCVATCIFGLIPHQPWSILLLCIDSGSADIPRSGTRTERPLFYLMQGSGVVASAGLYYGIAAYRGTRRWNKLVARGCIDHPGGTGFRCAWKSNKPVSRACTLSLTH